MNHPFKDSVASRTQHSPMHLATSHVSSTPEGNEFTAGYPTAVVTGETRPVQMVCQKLGGAGLLQTRG